MLPIAPQHIKGGYRKTIKQDFEARNVLLPIDSGPGARRVMTEAGFKIGGDELLWKRRTATIWPWSIVTNWSKMSGEGKALPSVGFLTKVRGGYLLSSWKKLTCPNTVCQILTPPHASRAVLEDSLYRLRNRTQTPLMI